MKIPSIDPTRSIIPSASPEARVRWVPLGLRNAWCCPVTRDVWRDPILKNLDIPRWNTRLYVFLGAIYWDILRSSLSLESFVDAKWCVIDELDTSDNSSEGVHWRPPRRDSCERFTIPEPSDVNYVNLVIGIALILNAISAISWSPHLGRLSNPQNRDNMHRKSIYSLTLARPRVRLRLLSQLLGTSCTNFAAPSARVLCDHVRVRSLQDLHSTSHANLGGICQASDYVYMHC